MPYKLKDPVRQTEGLIHSIVGLLKLNLSIPDHTALSRRARRVLLRKKSLPRRGSRIVIIVDSTGLKVVGEKGFCRICCEVWK